MANILPKLIDRAADSMNKVAVLSSRGEPWAFKAVEKKLDAVIAAATKLELWPQLEAAIDAKIEDQAEFVSWWDTHVLRKGGVGGHTDNADHALLSREDAERQTNVMQQQVSRFRKRHNNKTKYRESMILAAYRKADLLPPENHRAEGTGENEWFTPQKYIEAARSVMGGIDLDPATHPAAQQTVQAIEFFTRQDDGLSKEWGGRVWLNPPYAQPLIGQFVEKLVVEFAAGRVTEAIMLTHNYTDTSWFHLAETSASLICFTKGRIRFVDIDDEECSPTQGQAFFYYGANSEEFRSIFSVFGMVMRRA